VFCHFGLRVGRQRQKEWSTFCCESIRKRSKIAWPWWRKMEVLELSALVCLAELPIRSCWRGCDEKETSRKALVRLFSLRPASVASRRQTIESLD